MKKFVLGFIFGLVVSISGTAFAAGMPGIKSAVFTDVAVEVDGVKQEVEVVSVVKEGQENARNFVSVADLCRALDSTADWDGARNTVVVTKGGAAKTMATQIQASTQSNDEWIPLIELPSNYNLGLGVNGDEIVIYKATGSNEKLLVIDRKSNTPNVKIKVENDKTFISKTDLIREGIIKG